MFNTFLRSFFLLFFSVNLLFSEQITDSFRLDGYGNIEVSKEREREDNLKFSAGFQARYQFTDNLSFTGQLHFKEGIGSNGHPSNALDDYDSELKWLYFDYYLKDDLTLRAGAFQFPVFKSSETGDIGYTYTWTQTPLSFYGVFGCDEFQGLELLKNFSFDDFDILAQISYGSSDNELSDGRGKARNGNVDNLIGLTIKTTHEDFILNMGYLQAQSRIDDTGSPFLTDSKVKFSMFALESEIYINDYTLKSGLIKTYLSNIFPEDLKYYSSLEYNYGDFTPYILYSKEILNFKENSRPNPEAKKSYIERYSAGLRYDYNANIALKVSYSREIDQVPHGPFSRKNINNRLLGTINVVF